jgi:hypothetical protein
MGDLGSAFTSLPGIIGTAINPVGFAPMLQGAVEGKAGYDALQGDKNAGGKKSAPKPPDFMGLADKMDASNHPNQSNPFGSSQWTKGADGQWNGTQSLSGGLGTANDAMQGQLASAWGSPLDNGAQARQHAEDAIYGRASSRLDPQWQLREQQAKAELANQGLDPNSEAGGSLLSQLGRDRNDAYSTARQDAIMGGGQEASRQQAMDLQSRLAPLMGMQGLSALLGHQGNPGGANYMGAGAAQYGADSQAFQQNGGALGGYGQLMQALGPLLTAFMAGG